MSSSNELLESEFLEWAPGNWTPYEILVHDCHSWLNFDIHIAIFGLLLLLLIAFSLLFCSSTIINRFDHHPWNPPIDSARILHHPQQTSTLKSSRKLSKHHLEIILKSSWNHLEITSNLHLKIISKPHRIFTSNPHRSNRLLHRNLCPSISTVELRSRLYLRAVQRTRLD